MNVTKQAILLTAKMYAKSADHAKSRIRADELRKEIDAASREAREQGKLDEKRRKKYWFFK